MRIRYVSILVTIATLSTGTANAQQWNDVLGTINTSPGFNSSAQNPTGLPANSIYVGGYAANCPSGFDPVADGGPDTSKLNPVSLGGQCSMLQSAVINLDQFARQNELLAVSAQANRGIAMSLAMAGVAYLQPDEHIAFSGNWGTFQGENGGAVGVAYRLSEHVSVDGGVAGSFSGGTYGGRAGIRFGW